MQDEMDGLAKRGTFTYVKSVTNSKPLRTRFVLDLKRDGEGKLDKYKARCVVQGFNQSYGLDYLEVAAPVTSIVGLRIVMVFQLIKNCIAHHLDVS